MIGFWRDHRSAWINCSSWAGRLPQLDRKHLDPPPRPETRRCRSGSALRAHRTTSKTSMHANFPLSLTARKVKEKTYWLKDCVRERNHGAQWLEIHAFLVCLSVAPWVEKQSFLLTLSSTFFCVHIIWDIRVELLSPCKNCTA